MVHQRRGCAEIRLRKLVVDLNTDSERREMSMEGERLSTVKLIAGAVCLVYFLLIWSVSLLGLSQARHKYGKPRDKRRLSLLPSPLSATSTTAGPSGLSEGGPSSTALNVPSEGVSILRPLAGLDHNLLANLSSSFEQDFPRELYEIILSVRSEEDQALSVAQEVCSRYPHINSRIIVGDEPSSGVNPKIANLVRSYAAAQFDIIWVLDSQVQHGRSALRRAVHAMTSVQRPMPLLPSISSSLVRKPHGSRVGLAHHCPLAVTPHSTSLGSHIEAIFLGTNHAKMYLAINSLVVDSCVMGKSNFYRKSDLARVPDDFFNVGTEGTRGERGAIGSIAFQRASSPAPEPSTSTSTSSLSSSRSHVLNPHPASHSDPSSPPGRQQGEEELTSTTMSRPLARFGIFLAEDNMLALSLWRPPLSLGHVLLDADVARMTVGDVKSIRDYIKRRIRWIRVRRYMVPAATYVEPFTESILCTTIVSWAFRRIWVPYFFFHSTNQTVSLLPTMLFALLHLSLWHYVDFSVLASLQEAGGDSRGSLPTLVIDFDDPAQVRYYRFAWLCRELLAFPIWLTALCGSTVTWRDKQYRILSDARAARVESRPGRSQSTSSPSSSSSSSPNFFDRFRSPLTTLSKDNQNNRKRYDRLATEADP